MGVGFILSNELGHAQPPVSGSYGLFGFKVARVSSSLMIMEFFDQV